MRSDCSLMPTAPGAKTIRWPIAIRRAAWGGVFTGVGTTGYYLAYAYIVWRTLEGDFTIGDLSFLAASFRRLRALLQTLLTSFSSTAGQALYLNDLFSFFDMKPEILSPANALPFPSPIREGFVFDNVGFIYPGAAHWAVRNLSFTLQAGEVLALVGENGAGKTTLVKLLTRLYDPDEGRILLDGHDLREYDLEELRGSVGVIFQDFVRYNFSAGDNIAVGRIEARGEQARIERAAERFGPGSLCGRHVLREIVAKAAAGHKDRLEPATASDGGECFGHRPDVRVDGKIRPVAGEAAAGC